MFYLDRYTSTNDFLTTAESWLLQSEAENNLVLGVAYGEDRRSASGHSEQYWATLSNDGQIVGCAFRTPPHSISVTSMPAAAVPQLVDDVSSVYTSLPGANGASETVQVFAQHWCAARRSSYEVRTHLRIHVLHSVQFPNAVASGRLRRPLPSEHSLVRDWVLAFADEVDMQGNRTEAADSLAVSKKIFVWDDVGPKSLVACARETPNGSTISAVYTPAAFRGSGYATAAVATLSHQLLSAGKRFCCLYTDLNNPTSNEIYWRIGYRPVRDDLDIKFF